MVSRTGLIVWLCTAMLVCASSAPAQSPIVNPDFSSGLTGWTTYTYEPLEGTTGVAPTVGTYSSFYLLTPPTVPEITNMCGLQSYGVAANGGVCQTFSWTGGAAAISAMGRAYALDYEDNPYDNGVQVRMGIVDFETTDRFWVPQWHAFPWDYDWSTQTLLIPGPGTYTLFLEAYQPNADAYMCTVWGHVQMWEQTPINITSGPTLTPHPTQPENKAIVTWTTDIPSASEVQYGYTPGYGSVARDETLVTSHSVTLNGLSRQKLYHFRVRSDAFGHTEALSTDQVFRTPIWMENVTATITGEDTVTLDWTTDVPTRSQVEYWPEANGFHAYTNEDPNLVTTHHITVPNLKKGVYYCFRAWSRGAYLTDTSSAIQTLVILPPVSSSLQNASFDDHAIPDIPDLYPWVQYTAKSPGFYPIDGIIGMYPKGPGQTWTEAAIQAFDGECFIGSQAYWGYENGGVYQRVAVTPGQYYALNARFITRRLGGQDGYTMVRIGIDPDGGTDWTSSNVQWWTGWSRTNDNQWQLASLGTTVGSGGVATVFLDFYQRYSLEEHIAAIDDVTFAQPQITSIGALRSSSGNLGAILQNKIVTQAALVTVGADQYYRAYAEEDNRSSGIAVLFPLGQPDLPEPGNKVTVTGVLGVFGGEAAVFAGSWTVDTGVYALPKPLAMSHASIASASLNQPPLLGKLIGLCNIGLRMRLAGTVTWAEPGAGDETVIYLDDGSRVQDPSGNLGIRMVLPNKEGTTISIGNHIDATGVLSVKFVDPDEWPDPTDYSTYELLCASPDDWAAH